MNCIQHLCTAALVGVATLSVANAQTITVLLREGEPLAGAPGFNTTEFQDITVNSGGAYALCMTTTMGGSVLSRFWGSPNGGAGAILRTEQTAISGYDQTSFESNFGLSPTGSIGYSPICNPGAVDTVWLDGTPLTATGQAIPTIPGSMYRFSSRPGMTANGTIYWVSGLRTATVTDSGEALFMGAGITPVIKAGDAAPAPLVATVEDVSQDARFSSQGTHWIMQVNMSNTTTNDEFMLIDGQIVVLNGGGLVGEGETIQVAAGGDGIEKFSAAPRTPDINENGDYIFAWNTNGVGFPYVFVHNGMVVWHEGDVVDGLTPQNDPQGNINNAGDVALLWDTLGGVEAIYLNNEVLIKEGDPIDWDGDSIPETTLVDITSSIGKFLGERNADGSLDVYFLGSTAATVSPNPVREGYFRIHVPSPYVPYCFGDGSGTACPCTPVPLVGDADKGCPNSFNAGGGKLTASGTASIANDTLVMTCTTINNGGAVVYQGTNNNGGGAGTAFGDGLRCAAGSVMRMRSHAVTTNTHVYPDPMFGDNAISIRGAVVVPGDRYYQGWYRSGLAHCDPAANYNLTNAVKVTWLP